MFTPVLVPSVAVCSEPKLFQVANRSPQYPEKCRLPKKLTAAEQRNLRRRLGEAITREEAEKACDSWIPEEKEDCIYDVMATNDLELAQAGGY